MTSGLIGTGWAGPRTTGAGAGYSQLADDARQRPATPLPGPALARMAGRDGSLGRDQGISVYPFPFTAECRPVLFGEELAAPAELQRTVIRLPPGSPPRQDHRQPSRPWLTGRPVPVRRDLRVPVRRPPAGRFRGISGPYSPRTDRDRGRAANGRLPRRRRGGLPTSGCWPVRRAGHRGRDPPVSSARPRGRADPRRHRVTAAPPDGPSGPAR